MRIDEVYFFLRLDLALGMDSSTIHAGRQEGISAGDRSTPELE